MIDLKTGHMLGLSAQLGGILSNLNIDSQIKLREYGKLIGRAFQIQDDIFEVTSNAKIMGKSLESDFLLGKKTYLMIETKKRFPKEYGEILERRKKNNFESLNLYKELLINKGIVEECQEYVNATFVKADEVIDDVIPGEIMKKFTKMLRTRKY